jgi:hypothetical protein
MALGRRFRLSDVVVPAYGTTLFHNPIQSYKGRPDLYFLLTSAGELGVMGQTNVISLQKHYRLQGFPIKGHLGRSVRLFMVMESELLMS